MMILQRLLGTKAASDSASGLPPSQLDFTPSDDVMDTETEDKYLPGQPSLNDIDEDNDEASSPHSMESLPNKRLKTGETGYVSVGGKDSVSTTSTGGGSHSPDDSIVEPVTAAESATIKEEIEEGPELRLDGLATPGLPITILY
eukprot:TRINITY_DN2624_c0_g1_i2.p1 TRINITY_DN2624_c0_g1~~TRINITY_DN2624_c0_g1_i2.p1  ORF type:complete len:144 (+),score=23.05 TRINITY_DN2624_c0_g1_i2:208-639(+)